MINFNHHQYVDIAALSLIFHCGDNNKNQQHQHSLMREYRDLACVCSCTFFLLLMCDNLRTEQVGGLDLSIA